MTIQEAIQSGKAYRRKSQTYWFKVKLKEDLHTFSKQDILATDWEVEEEKIEITEEQLERVMWDRINHLHVSRPENKTYIHTIWKLLKEYKK